ncbi:hypothetical protein [Paenibacillus turpanensis]|uniref:hypothetical protein n=1 Tax=Paenibacillus turpanensis TaxID=2689078 RepID=UPI00140A9CDA|nr:hypothetical protein [Paenibacillus turpanensis]
MLERIIDFVMGNIFFIAVALFSLFSLFKKTVQGEQEKKPQQSMPPFGNGGPGPQKTGRPRAAQAERKEQPEGPRSSPFGSPEPAQAAPAQSSAGREPEPSSARMRAAEAPAPSLLSGEGVGSGEGGFGPEIGEGGFSVASVKTESGAIAFADEEAGAAVSVDDARQGLIWAEVFEPPRAKRPLSGPRGGWPR